MFDVRCFLILSGLLLLSGCAAPISAERARPRATYQQAKASALNGNYYSDGTRLVLRRYDLVDEFESRPVETLHALHEKARSDERRDLLSALAELNYLHALHAEREVKYSAPRNSPDYFLASVLYAYIYLFGGTSGIAERWFDPRTRLAADLYNAALARAFTRPGDTNHVVRLSGGPRKLPQGEANVQLDVSRFPWKLEDFDQLLSADDFKVRGLSVRNRDPGLGSPLIGVKTKTPDVLVAPRVPVTIFLRMTESPHLWTTGAVPVVVEVQSAYESSVVDVAGQKIPLATDTTVPIAHMLGSVSVWDTDFARFFSSKETIKTGIHPMEPYQPGRVPVIFVHGTVSSPLWWGEMLNTLYSDPVLRERCQFWLYAYNTGLPVAISAATFREAVSNYVQRLDPEGKDPTLRQIVVVGHSQGGLLAKLAVTSPGDKLWRAVSDRNLDEVTLKPEQREWLRRALFFNAVPAITRVVFICTPHRGSYRATSFVRRLAARLVTLPSRFVMTTQDALTLKKELRLPAEYHLSSPTSLEGMSPKNPVLLAMAEIPPVPGVTAHSIIAAKDPGKVPEANDGIVEYSSAHVPYVESELIVRSGHTAQDKSPTIEEIRRILLEHLRSLSAKNP